MKPIVLVLAITSIYVGLAAAGPQLVKQPDFRKETKPKSCKLPNGERVACKHWNFDDSIGWKRACVGKDENPLSAAPSNDDDATIRSPKGGCTAVFDREWADHKDFTSLFTDEEYIAEGERIPERAVFSQYVKVRKPGTHKFVACMSAGTDIHSEDLHSGGGIVARLLKVETDGETLLAEMPKKGQFSNPLSSTEGLTVISEDEWLPENPERHDIVGIVDAETGNNWMSVFIHDGDYWSFVGSSDYDHSLWDGYRGHSGLRTAYRQYDYGFGDLNAIWTCHRHDLHLEKGVHRIEAEFLTNDYDNDSMTLIDYRGFGSIRHLGLKKIGR